MKNFYIKEEKKEKLTSNRVSEFEFLNLASNQMHEICSLW